MTGRALYDVVGYGGRQLAVGIDRTSADALADRLNTSTPTPHAPFRVVVHFPAIEPDPSTPAGIARRLAAIRDAIEELPTPATAKRSRIMHAVEACRLDALDLTPPPPHPMTKEVAP